MVGVLLAGGSWIEVVVEVVVKVFDGRGSSQELVARKQHNFF